MNYLTISFYQLFFTSKKWEEDLEKEQKNLRNAFEKMGVKGRIYLSKEGINAQISIEKNLYQDFSSWRSLSKYKDAALKIQEAKEHAFYKLGIKIRKQLCAFDQDVAFENAGEKISPKEWKKMLDEKKGNIAIIDVRNDYESEVGHFAGAILPRLSNFREFPGYTEELKKKVDPEKDTLLMYCTGGIRCEYYSSYLKKQGFRKMYQLDGGVIQYANEVGSDHWEGKLFVFDDRLTVPVGSDAVLSTCTYCGAKADTYYNCANMDCNTLFTCCPKCAKENIGLCSADCKHGRVRPFDSSESPKPFRKLTTS